MSKKEQLFVAHIITLGDTQVGKSSLMFQYTDKMFSQEYLTTIGVDLKYKELKLKNGEIIKVKIYDTAGQERFISIASNYLKKANGILLVYDITNESSYDNISNWLEQINSKSDNERPIILIGNKSDMVNERVISKEKGEELAKNCCGGINFYETSCKTGENVNEAINDLVYQIYNKYSGKNLNDTGNIKIDQGEKGKGKKKKKCC